jgi:hypothetical protein
MHKMETAIFVPDAKLELWDWIGLFPSKHWGVSQYEYDNLVRWPWGVSSSQMVWGREICPVLLHMFGVSQVIGVDLLGYICLGQFEGLSREKMCIWSHGSLMCTPSIQVWRQAIWPNPRMKLFWGVDWRLVVHVKVHANDPTYLIFIRLLSNLCDPFKVKDACYILFWLW